MNPKPRAGRVTSALDSESEGVVQKAIDLLTKAKDDVSLSRIAYQQFAIVI